MVQLSLRYLSQKKPLNFLVAKGQQWESAIISPIEDSSKTTNIIVLETVIKKKTECCISDNMENPTVFKIVINQRYLKSEFLVRQSWMLFNCAAQYMSQIVEFTPKVRGT